MASRLGVGILPSRLRSSETQATTPAAPGWRKRSSAAAATAGTEPRAATASSARGNERQGILRVAERDAVARRPAEFVQCPPRPDGPVDTRRQPPRDRIGAADRRRSRGPAGLAPARAVSQDATTSMPAWKGALAARRRPRNPSLGGAPRTIVRSLFGCHTTAPFSATTVSKAAKSTTATRRSSRTRPVTRRVTRPASRTDLARLLPPAPDDHRSRRCRRSRRRSHDSPSHLQSDLRRTVSTGQGADGTTRSAVLPKKRRFVPERPCVPIAIRSAPIELA